MPNPAPSARRALMTCVVRNPQSMFVRKKELSDGDLDFVWKAMDNDRSGSISLTEVQSDHRLE